MVKNHLIDDDGLVFFSGMWSLPLFIFYFLINVWFFNVSTLNLNAAKSDFKRAAVFKLMDIKHLDIMLV